MNIHSKFELGIYVYFQQRCFTDVNIVPSGEIPSFFDYTKEKKIAFT